MEIRQQGDGSLFVRMVQEDLRSDATTTNAARKDFSGLIKQYEPPVTMPTPDTDGIVLLRRELVKRYGTLNTLQEFIVSNGFGSSVMKDCVSNGYLVMNMSTAEYHIVTNGEERPGKKDTIDVLWPTNYTYVWVKKERRTDDGWMLTDMYDAFLAAGRMLPWADEEDDTTQGAH